jgi:6-pyruvoyltetrahydropterin/6-carboxytetrahydropterin synthase
VSTVTTLTRQVVVRAIHHLENASLSPDENRKLYGVCYGRHGHHYKVQVTVTGTIDPKTGLVMSRDELDAILKREIVDPFDGVDLNQVLPNTACEALAEAFYHRLSPHFAIQALVRISIQETKKNYFEYPPET